jgi:hypothetical protein
VIGFIAGLLAGNLGRNSCRRSLMATVTTVTYFLAVLSGWFLNKL